MEKSRIDRAWRAEAMGEGLAEGHQEGIRRGGATPVLPRVQPQLGNMNLMSERPIQALPAQQLEAGGSSLGVQQLG
ncbi:MAG: hypothetical protein Q6L60_03550 [Thermostichus sp. HHBFW_bins_43]